MSRTAAARRIAAPTDVANCIAWWDANTGATSAGGLVSALADRSGAGNALASSGANRPTLVASSAIFRGAAIDYGIAADAAMTAAISGLTAGFALVVAIELPLPPLAFGVLASTGGGAANVVGSYLGVLHTYDGSGLRSAGAQADTAAQSGGRIVSAVVDKGGACRFRVNGKGLGGPCNFGTPSALAVFFGQTAANQPIGVEVAGATLHARPVRLGELVALERFLARLHGVAL